MTTRENRTTAWIDQPVFWTIILVVLFFLVGVGLGTRLAMLGVRQQLAQLNLNNTNQTELFTEASGEVAGTINSVDPLLINVIGIDNQPYTFSLGAATSIFAYVGESTPLLPGEMREKTTLTLADLQPNDMVVVRYTTSLGGPEAVSIQKIR